MRNRVNKSLEKIVNTYLGLDPESAKRLFSLEGKIITIELRAVNITFYLKIANKKIIFLDAISELPDVTICGTPLALLRVSLNKENRRQLFSEDVSITGNLELGQQIIDLFDRLEIDWEEYFSHITGDVVAHQTGRFLGEMKRAVLRVHESFLQNINDYVHEEKLWFPQREMLNHFFHDIDALRMSGDRLEARINYLKKIIEDTK